MQKIADRLGAVVGSGVQEIAEQGWNEVVETSHVPQFVKKELQFVTPKSKRIRDSTQKSPSSSSKRVKRGATRKKADVVMIEDEVPPTPVLPDTAVIVSKFAQDGFDSTAAYSYLGGRSISRRRWPRGRKRRAAARRRLRR